MRDACLVLEDGSVFLGKALGKKNNRSFGEIVFNTGLTGYQEILTDPSYAGQIVTLTYPEIGNYGVNSLDNQSRKVFAAGLVIKNASPIVSSWRSDPGMNLDDFLLSHDLSAISQIDTRALTRRIRSKGAMRAVLSTVLSDLSNIDSLLQQVSAAPEMNGLDLASGASIEQSYTQKANQSEALASVVVLDFGLKKNMLNLMNQQGLDLTVVPASSSFDEIMALKPDGIFLSNGPGDPSACSQAQDLTKELIDKSNVPIFGVCLGHQILSLALGAKTFKLKFGHRGSNHPVKDLSNNKIFITSQNHGFAVDENTLPVNEVKVSHRSLNDETVEGIEHLKKPIFSVQFHPEASPGPDDTQYLFEKFAKLVSEHKKPN